MARTRENRFKKYDGGDPLAPPVDLAEALDAIGEDVMAGYSPEHAMREFLRRGGRDQTGLDDLARRVAEKRRELLERHGLDGTMAEVKELGGTGGVIVVSPKGEATWSFNTPGMYRAMQTHDSEAEIAIHGDE